MFKLSSRKVVLIYILKTLPEKFGFSYNLTPLPSPPPIFANWKIKSLRFFIMEYFLKYRE